jgi:cation-transporting P-type ATPase E
MWHDALVTNEDPRDVTPAPPVGAGANAPTNHGVPDLPADLGATPASGLTGMEAAARAARGLGNDARIATGRTYAEILRDNVLQPVNILLGIICLVLAALGLYGDAAVTIVLVLVNIVVGLFQEVRAKRSLDRLSVLTRPTATVIRDGAELTLDPSGVVLGDLVVVRRGDQLLLDGKVSLGTFQADESLLTGESDRIPKALGAEVLSGSFCVDGEARYVATRVGAGTFANQLTAGARAFRADRTPLQQDVARVLRGMSLLVLVAAVPVLLRLYQQFGTLPAVETARAAAVLVALIPQGLVVMITVTYAMAIVRLAGQKALIQRSNAVESMSRVSVLCLDKTGTLTTPEIEVAEVHALGDEDELARWLGSFVASTTLQNRSSDAIRERYPEGATVAVAEEVPFSSELRWSAIRVADGDLAGALVLGAPEVLGPNLAAVPGGHEAMDLLVHEKAAEGLRVVLFACRRGTTTALLDGDVAQLPTDLEPLGVLVLQERIRPDARATLARFADAGVTLKLISGDNPVTVAALARQVGLSLDGEAISGLELAQMDDAQLAEAVRTRSVFGRVPPSLKARLVGTLRESGEWVAMVGDGVNDILSLKQAQLGISMQSGSQATRAVADIVLLEDSFSALPEAVLEGQRIISGMHDSLAVFLTRVLYMTLAILGASLLGLPMPVDPKLNTVVALLTVGIPALFLAFWAQPKRSSLDALRQILRLVGPPAVALVFLGVPLYWWADPTADVDRARTLFTTFAVFCGLALLVLLHPPVGRPSEGAEARRADIRPTFLAVAMLAAFGLFFLITPVREFFELTTLSASDVLVTGTLAAVWAALVLVLWHTGMYDRVMTVVASARARIGGQPAA